MMDGYDGAGRYGDAAEAMAEIGQAGSQAARSVAGLTDALQRNQVTLEALVRGVERGTARMQTQWRRAMREMAADLARWLDEAAGHFAGLSAGGGSLVSDFGNLLGMAAGHGRPSHVAFAHPHVDRPPGTILPGALAAVAERSRMPVQVTVAEGAVQISTQTLDERTVAGVAEQLAERIQRRLAFEDRRFGTV